MHRVSAGWVTVSRVKTTPYDRLRRVGVWAAAMIINIFPTSSRKDRKSEDGGHDSNNNSDNDNDNDK